MLIAISQSPEMTSSVFTITLGKEEQEILTFNKLEKGQMFDFCQKNVSYNESIIIVK